METERQKEISREIDRMWDAHILACLAIINAWMEKDK